ncbi:MAG: carbon storage regulator [Candidatus Thiodiazotropha sp. 6PLUC2]
MLVLTRHLNQSLQVGEAVTLKILSVNNGNVRFGIDAPAEVLILREELAHRMSAPSIQSEAKSPKKREPQVTYKPRRKKLVTDMK